MSNTIDVIEKKEILKPIKMLIFVKESVIFVDVTNHKFLPSKGLKERGAKCKNNHCSPISKSA